MAKYETPQGFPCGVRYEVKSSELFPTAGQNRAGLLVRSEVFGAVHIENFSESGARSIDARFDGADSATANVGCFFV